MSSIIRGTDGLDSSNIATDTELVNGLALKANTADLKEIGVGQTWTDVTASRSAGVTYTNNTGKPIMVSVRCASGNYFYTITVGSSIVDQLDLEAGVVSCLKAIVPNNSTYYVGSGGTISNWFELR